MSKATRQAFGEALAELGQKNKDIAVLDADLSKSTKSDLFAKKFPERFIEMGIAEANMIGTAAGLSFSNKKPFLCSFGTFLTGRYDTIRLSVAYSRAPLVLVGTHAGIGIGDDGHSQMGLEDVALMRALPEMRVFQPMDEKETALLMEYLVQNWTGPAYLRLTRQNLPVFYPEGAPFNPTKLLRIGPDLSASKKRVVAIGSGAGVAEAHGAVSQLKLKGIDLEVWNACSLKPFDHDRVKSLAKTCELMISVEDHSVIGGLGSCVEEALASMASHAPLKKFGVQDTFGESGEAPELFEKHGFSSAQIADAILRWMAKE